jgi:glyoxylase-like metal-dependent hydrolase (beta-lactamase superfamily II)
MTKQFASKGDLAPKQTSFTRLSENAWAYTTEGDPNSGAVVTDDGVLVVDATATPAMARELIAHVRSVTDKPIRYLVLSHYHAVRVLGASAYGAQEIIASRGTYDLIAERGDADWKS